MNTPYKEAWDKFQQSDEFKKQIRLMKEAEPRTNNIYLRNRIQRIFDAGWNASEESKKS